MKITIPDMVEVDSLCIAFRWRSGGTTWTFALFKVGDTEPRMLGAGSDLADANEGISEGARHLGCALTIIVKQPWPPMFLKEKEVPRA